MGRARSYVANIGNSSVTVFAAGATANAAPTTTISGNATGLSFPFGVSLDGAGSIHVANQGDSSVRVFANPTLLPQAIAFTAPDDTPVIDGPVTMVATGGDSGNPVTFTTTTPSVCTPGGTNGVTVSLDAVGTCTINADQTGNDEYSPAPQVTKSFEVTKGATGLPQSQAAMTKNLGVGKTVVNRKKARTVQGQKMKAKVTKVRMKGLSTRGDIRCYKAITGPKRKLAVKITGQCAKVKVWVTYTAEGTDTYNPYENTIRFVGKQR